MKEVDNDSDMIYLVVETIPYEGSYTLAAYKNSEDAERHAEEKRNNCITNGYIEYSTVAIRLEDSFQSERQS